LWFLPLLYAVLLYWFAYIKPYLHSWNKTNLIMVYDLFNVLLNLVWKYFTKKFYVYVHQRNWPIIFFFVVFVSLLSFGIGVILALYTVFGTFFPFLLHGLVWGVLVLILL
jgi:hypothetical protein